MRVRQVSQFEKAERLRASVRSPAGSPRRRIHTRGLSLRVRQRYTSARAAQRRQATPASVLKPGSLLSQNVRPLPAAEPGRFAPSVCGKYHHGHHKCLAGAAYWWSLNRTAAHQKIALRLRNLSWCRHPIRLPVLLNASVLSLQNQLLELLQEYAAGLKTFYTNLFWQSKRCRTVLTEK